MTALAGRSSRRTSPGERSASPRSEKRPAVPEPCKVTTNGLPANLATAAPASQFACTRSALLAAPRSERTIDAKSGGASQGRPLTLATSPAPPLPVRPKSR